MRHARTPKFQLSGPTVHPPYCGLHVVFLAEFKKSLKIFWIFGLIRFWILLLALLNLVLINKVIECIYYQFFTQD